MNTSLAFSPAIAQLRPMQNSDLSDVMGIENAVYSQHWTPHTLANCLRVGYEAWVLEKADYLMGYGFMSTGAGEAHILNLCVHPLYQRQGYGRQILEHLLAIARKKAVDSVFLEVRCSNSAALNLYLKMGFNQIAIRKHYYPVPHSVNREDALILALTLFIA